VNKYKPTPRKGSRRPERNAQRGNPRLGAGGSERIMGLVGKRRPSMRKKIAAMCRLSKGKEKKTKKGKTGGRKRDNGGGMGGEREGSKDSTTGRRRDSPGRTNSSQKTHKKKKHCWQRCATDLGMEKKQPDNGARWVNEKNFKGGKKKKGQESSANALRDGVSEKSKTHGPTGGLIEKGIRKSTTGGGGKPKLISALVKEKEAAQGNLSDEEGTPLKKRTHHARCKGTCLRSGGWATHLEEVGGMGIKPKGG